MFFMLKDAGFSPDLLSYAAALQCMGRLDQDASTIQRWGVSVWSCWGHSHVAGAGKGGLACAA